MDQVNGELLDQAVARNCAVVLSFPSAGMLRHCKSRFVGECREGVWVESPGEQRLLADELIQSSQAAGCSFKSGHNKVVFATPLLRREPAYAISADVMVEAVLLRRPKEIKAVQRRSSYRVGVPNDAEMKVRLWRMGTNDLLTDRPTPSREINAKPLDLSVNGIGLLLEPSAGRPVKIEPLDRLRIEITVGEQVLLTEASLRFPPQIPDGQVVRAGFEFLALDGDIEGRRVTAMLTRLSGELQRQELRRFRMGLS